MAWPDIYDLIPHRPPILLVESIVHMDDGEAVCRGVLPPYDAAGRAAVAPPFLALELAAQTAAVLVAVDGAKAGDLNADDPDADDGASSSAGGEPPIGYLAAIREARFAVPEIPARRRLLARVEITGRMAALTVFAATVSLEDGGAELVTATMSTYRAQGSR